jgi:hypothetical protein
LNNFAAVTGRRQPFYQFQRFINAIRITDDFGISGRRNTPENQLALTVLHIDAIQGHYVGSWTTSSTFIPA